MKTLDECGLRENTIVIFSSDNGTTHLKDEVDYDFFESVGELRGLKGSLYEGGVRVPTMVRWPGKVKPGSSSDRVSGFEDWMPTILEMVGATDATPKSIDGISLAATLRGNSHPERPFLYREFPSYGSQQSVRVGPWKAVRQNMSRGPIMTELYNLESDPSEKNDLADQHPDVVARLESIMKREHTPSKIFPLPGVDKPTRKRGASR